MPGIPDVLALIGDSFLLPYDSNWSYSYYFTSLTGNVLWGYIVL